MKATKIFGGWIAASAALCLLATGAIAQDDDNGPMTQGEDAKYISVTHVRFHPGKRERAMELINEYFVKAGEKAGTAPPMLGIHYQTGKWDAAWVWVMEGGMADLEWYRSPDDMKWWAALVEIAGGEEEAGELWGEYISLVADAVTEVGHYHTGEED